MKIPGPLKTPPEGVLQPLQLDASALAEVPDARLHAPVPASRLHAPVSTSRLRASQRSGIPPFEVMQITEEIARRRAAGRDVVSLCAGEPSPWAVRGELPALGYTGPLGTTELREAIAGHYREWYDVSIPAARVAVTTGSSGAFQLAFLTAFDAGDRVALASPGYPAYKNILLALGIEVVEIQAGPETRYQPTPELLDAAARERGDLAGLILASPANPTGTMLGRAELAALVDWCRAHGARLVSDEIYHGITYPAPGDPDPRGVSVSEFDPEAIVVNSFSKYWGLTGWRLGWAILPEGLVASFEALASNLALSPPAPAQHLALGAFAPEVYAERDAVVEGFARARQLILDAEPELGWGAAAPSDGAFYYYSDLGPQLERFGDASSYARALLERADVALVPGGDFDSIAGHRSVRISYAAGEAAVAEALERIIRFQR